jgi:hypothetical protein
MYLDPAEWAILIISSMIAGASHIIMAGRLSFVKHQTNRVIDRHNSRLLESVFWIAGVTQVTVPIILFLILNHTHDFLPERPLPARILVMVLIAFECLYAMLAVIAAKNLKMSV